MKLLSQGYLENRYTKITGVHACVMGSQWKLFDPESTLAHLSVEQLIHYWKGATEGSCHGASYW